MVYGINLLHQNVSNGTNCNLDPAIFDLIPWKIVLDKKGPLNFSLNGKLDLRPKIIQFLVNVAIGVIKVVGFIIRFKDFELSHFFRAKYFFVNFGQNILTELKMMGESMPFTTHKTI